jgi:hypothetical protein
LLVALVFASACSIFHDEAEEQRQKQEAQERQENVRRRLRELVDVVSSGFEQAGRTLAESCADIPRKRTSVFLRKSAIEAARGTLTQADPVIGTIDLWTMCVQFRDVLQEGDGKDLFGDLQSIAIQAAQEVLTDIEDIAAKAVEHVKVEKVREDVYAFAREHPIQGAFGRLGMQPSDFTRTESKDMFSWLPSVSLGSLNPFSGVSSGIVEGAAAVNEVGRVADRFTDVVEFLPQQVGWQLELFLYDLEESRQLGRVTEGIDVAANSAKTAVEVVRDLPALVRAELEHALADLDPKLAEVRATLHDASTAAAALDHTGVTFGQVAMSLEAMAAQLDKTLTTFQATYTMLAGAPAPARGTEGAAAPEPSDEPKARPFDVLDFEKTARSVTAMAAQLESTLAGVHGLVADDKVRASLGEVGATTQETVGSVIRTAVLGAIAVLVAFFALLYGYRALSRRGVSA